ncbi:hypothetical protein HB764_25600 (plasmid) [Vibrio campbellii]|nr:hypothetical protein HB764_25600 [Vibrio campbellii]
MDVGGFTVREAGWYLKNGDLFAITKYPASYKTVPSSGAATELPIRTYLATGAVENIQLKIDPTVVFATRSYVEQYQKIHVIDVAVSFRCLNVFNGFGDIKLPVAKDGEWFLAKVDHSVSLSAGECAFVAPDGEYIKVMNHGDVEEHDRINIVQKGAEFRFYRNKGGWRV